ncbi:hypothetical protein IAQ61_009026 [Plenodomus lingam]|uniref:Predicted protein n=1 Tax=Leptosphaeria maculans (strain JN3 / isolate v23.1.3 / race Av1-4-5-6-7-8) TaxID=985895 RepID=E4ZNU6_LEPMJ|nr:predicted protein [Plenodomus lingam JN3]KAH9865080.1 hypothetical protein IAQ61_009026 [Plenodomus lingam]CBX93315.1 predicted protein [Plenodomus lingam JN3]
MQLPLTLLLSATLASTTVSAASLNFLTWNCPNCQDNATCQQQNYQNVFPGPIPDTCFALRVPFPQGLKIFGQQDCPRGEVDFYATSTCTDTPLAYRLETSFPSPGNPTCHNETALTTRTHYRILC